MTTMNHRQGRFALTGLLAVMVLAGCASQGDLARSVRPVAPERYGVQAVGDAAPQAESAWWMALGDPQLNALIDTALRDSPTLQSVQARLSRAQAAVGLQSAADKPQLQGKLQIDRQRFTEHGLYPPPVAGASLTSGTVQLQGQWELDLFGRQRAQLDAALGQARAASADAQAARVLLSANVARAYVQLARQMAQREVAVRALAQRDELLSLIRQRVQAGLDTLVEQRQGEGALPETRQQIEALDEQIALSRHQIAALTAQPMDATATLAPRLAVLPQATVPAEVPVNLLAQRADVRANRWRAEAAGAEVDAARTLFYPNLNITAYLGFNAIGLDKVLKSGSDQFGLMPALDLPLFDAGRRRANLKGRLADQDNAVAAYNQSVLEAVHEVADQLVSARSVERQRAEQQAAQSAAESAYDIARQRYSAGLGPYLSVLSAEAAVLNQRRLAVDLQARALDVRVTLTRALGGQWPAPATAFAVAPVSAL